MRLLGGTLAIEKVRQQPKKQFADLIETINRYCT